MPRAKSVEKWILNYVRNITAIGLKLMSREAFFKPHAAFKKMLRSQP